MYTYLEHIIQGAAGLPDYLALAQDGCSVIAFFIGIKAVADGLSIMKRALDFEDVSVTAAGGMAAILGVLSAGFGNLPGVVFAIMACGLSKSLSGYLIQHVEKRRKAPVTVAAKRQADSLDGIVAPTLRDSYDFADGRDDRARPEPEHIPRIKGAAVDRPVQEDDEDTDRESSSEEDRRKKRDIKLS